MSLNASVIGSPSNGQVPYPTGAVEFWDSLNGASSQLLTVQQSDGRGGRDQRVSARLKSAAGDSQFVRALSRGHELAGGNSAAVPLVASTFSVGVSPNPIPMAAGSAGSGTVTITPSGGFTGTVTLTCATGGTVVPAGYTCSFGNATPQVNNATTTTTLNFTPSSTAAAGTKSASAAGAGGLLWGTILGGGLLLVGFVAAGGSGTLKSRNFLAARGLGLCVVIALLGCGGGGSGGGPVSTTTVLRSSGLKVPFGMPVTLTVTVTPNGGATPTGAVQLYDNGQTYGGPVNVSAGIATFLATSLPVGVHNLTAEYRGDANTQASNSAPIAQAITGTVAMQISGSRMGLWKWRIFL